MAIFIGIKEIARLTIIYKTLNRHLDITSLLFVTLNTVHSFGQEKDILSLFTNTSLSG